jgi:hypothetical protein
MAPKRGTKRAVSTAVSKSTVGQLQFNAVKMLAEISSNDARENGQPEEQRDRHSVIRSILRKYAELI